MIQKKSVFIIIALVVLIFFFLFVFGDKKIRLDREITVVVFGDSLTEGTGVEVRDSFPVQLQEKLNENELSVRVINKGVSGDTSALAFERIDEIIELKPDIVILAIGSNDGIRKVDPSFTKNNISKIIKKLNDNNIDIILCGMRILPRYGLKYSDEFKAIYKDLAREYNLVFMPFFLEGVMLNPKLNIEDGIHPNREGYVIVVENLYPYLLEILKKI